MSKNPVGSPASDNDELLLKIKEEDDRAMDEIEEKVHKQYQKKLQEKKNGKNKKVRTSVEFSDGDAGSPEMKDKRTTSGMRGDGEEREDGLMFNVNQQKEEDKEMNKRKIREQVKVYAITYISYALIHFQREFWSLSKSYIIEKHPEDLSKQVLSRFDTA